MRLAIAVVLLCGFCVPLFAENAVDILDLNTGTPTTGAAPGTAPADPDSKNTEVKKSTPTSGVVDEPGFKATVKFSARPTPNFDQSTTNEKNMIPAPKSKAWAVPLEEGANGPKQGPPKEVVETPVVDSTAVIAEDISPALAGAIARQKAGAKAAEMVPLFRSVVNSEKESAAPHYHLGLALVHSGELQNGLVELEQAIAIQPKNPKYLCDYGVAALRAGWIEKSFAATQAAVSLNPGSARYLSALGDVHLAANHLPEAVETYTRAVKLDPDNSVYFYNLGLAYMHARDFKRGAESISEAIRLKPVAAYYCSRGLAFENMKIHKNAINDYTAAIKLDKNCAYAHYLFAGIFSDPDDPTYTNKFEAIEHAQKAVKITDSKNAQYLMGLARAHRVARDYDRAVAAAKKACELEPARSDFRKELAEIEQSKMQGLAKSPAPF